MYKRNFCWKCNKLDPVELIEPIRLEWNSMGTWTTLSRYLQSNARRVIGKKAIFNDIVLFELSEISLQSSCKTSRVIIGNQLCNQYFVSFNNRDFKLTTKVHILIGNKQLFSLSNLKSVLPSLIRHKNCIRDSFRLTIHSSHENACPFRSLQIFIAPAVFRTASV